MEEEASILAPDMGEFLVLKRILHSMESSKEENHKEHIFHSWYTIKAKYVA